MKDRIAAVILFAAAACAAQPQPDEFEGKPWEVLKAQLPPYPRSENLLRVHVSSTMAFAFFVDAASVSVRQDGIVRYTLVARSTSGAVNVSYEGIRCQPLERKSYAFGRPDSAWSPAGVPQWVRIQTQTNPQHAALAEDFFCPESRRVRTTEEAVQALRRGNIPGLGR